MNLPRILESSSSIRGKLLLINFMTTGTILVVVTVMLTIAGFVSGRSEMQYDLEVQASMISANSTAAVVFGDAHSAEEILSALRYSRTISEAAIYLPDKTLFAGYRRDASGDAAGPGQEYMHSSGNLSLTHLDLYGDIRHDDQVVGLLYIQADMYSLYLRMLWGIAAILLLTLAAMALGFWVMNRMQRSITLPISRLADISRQISVQGDYSVRAAVESSDEVGILAANFNRMLDQIQKRDRELETELAERIRTEEKLDRLAYYDSVTSLPNRYYFNERLSAAVAKSRRFGDAVVLMFLDMDNFKVINDTLGHHVGDELLAIIADRLKKALRSGDIICRVGGDEFAVILENNCDIPQGMLVAKKCISAVSGPMSANGNEVYVTLSIGISVCPHDTDDMHELLKNADTAMYHAKARGKNTYELFQDDMRGKAQKRLSMETSMRRAIERGEFVLHYQPQIELATRRIVGVEALVRWNHPEKGMVSPLDFIPLAEDTGLIVPIGEWVLYEACRQMQSWKDAGLGSIRVAVNLSVRQIREQNIVSSVLAMLQQTGIDPDLLELELTESCLLEGRIDTINTLHSLRDAGVSLALDDFGTGYSSMSYLRRFPISILKVDRSFVKDLPTDSDAAAITRAIIAMANTLKLQVIAEGVETEDQAEYLAESGCTIVQGFLFSRPLPADGLENLIHGGAFKVLVR